VAASSNTPRHRIDYIDGLRAVAVLTVVAAHVAQHTNMTGATAHVLLEGAHGVDLFFVLSGFCLAFPTLAKLRGGSAAFDVVDFGTKRLVRILPPFYIATAALLAVLVLPHLAVHRALPGDLPSARDLFASLLFLDGNVHLLNDSFWTLMVEFRWYFAFPLLLWLWVASPRAFGVVGLASLALYHLTRARGLDFGTLPGFMLGIVAADVQLGGPHSAIWGRHLRRWALPLGLLALLAGVLTESTATIPGFNHDDVRWPYQPTILGWQVAMFALVVLAGASGLVRGVLSMRALVAAGIASYGIYLVHEPAIIFAAPHLHGAFARVLAGVLAVAAGFAFWALAERPFTTGSLRVPLLTWIRPHLGRLFAFTGVGGTIRLTARLPEPQRATVPTVSFDSAEPARAPS
jgi:peptidoglycan/LPS O-acetylase OafA/YrhL